MYEVDDEVPTAELARFLLNHITWLRHRQDGPEAVEEITSAVNAITNVIDRPAEQVFAGRCVDCGEGLYGKLGATSIDCRECGREHQVSEMQEWMLADAASRLVTAREAVILLGRMGRTVQQKTVDTWVTRKRLVVRGHDPEGKRLYLFADLDQLTQARTRCAQCGFYRRAEGLEHHPKCPRVTAVNTPGQQAVS